jgi:L-iditol 2-dehydrogenase
MSRHRVQGRVAVLGASGHPIELREYEVPEPEPGGAILKIEQSAICGSDLHIWRGDTAGDAAGPAALGFGHEGFGTVFALGKGTTADDAGRPLAIGDRVIHHVMPSPGGRTAPANSRRVYGEWPYFFSTFADYFYVSATRALYRVPDALPDDVLPSVNCAMGAAVNALIRGGVGFGSTVVVLGAGGLGLTATAAAKAMGAATVIVSDLVPARLGLARQFGADHTIDASELPGPGQAAARVREITDGRGADVVLELVGLASLVPEGVAMLGPGGVFVEVGLFFTGHTAPFDPSTVLRGNKSIIGSAGYPPALIPKILDFLVRVRGSLPFDKVISHRFPLAEINEAFKASDWSQAAPGVTRAVLIP